MKKLHLSIALACCGMWMMPLSLYAQDNDAQENISHAITTLAASCAACHGPQGNSLGGTPTLAALNKDYFIQRMQGFKKGSISSTVMHHHAKGLKDEEITALANYFALQQRHTPTVAPHQSFQGAQ
ncbi:c-type cytochrome [Methylophilus sp. Leaf408]|uniref:c-type cytochrome n=1 Tax=Methylophilus sp. Leaf408 TaxID=2876561 RepID=UPI001E2D9B91|nr:c-type cytochrome [Methylophilus sp. Leaf408]